MQDKADSEKTILRVKLDDLSSSLKKISGVFKQIGGEKSVYLLENQMINDLLALAGQLESFESLEEKDGEIFASFIKNLLGVIQNIGTVSGWEKKYNEEELTSVISNLRGIEEKLKDLEKLVIVIDDERKKSNFESLSGLLVKVIDSIEEKRYMISKNLS